MLKFSVYVVAALCFVCLVNVFSAPTTQEYSFGSFSNPEEVKAKIEEVENDSNLTEDDRAQQLECLNELYTRHLLKKILEKLPFFVEDSEESDVGKIFSQNINSLSSQFSDENPKVTNLRATLETVRVRSKFDFKQTIGDSFKKALNSTKNVIVKESKDIWKKIKNDTIKFSKSAYKELKNISIECLNQTKIALVKIPEKAIQRFEECSSNKISEIMQVVIAKVDFSQVEFSKEDLKKKFDDCAQNKNTNVVDCISTQMGPLLDATKVEFRDENGNVEYLLEHTLNAIVGCGDLPDIQKNLEKTITDVPLNCMIVQLMSRIPTPKE